MSYAQFVSNETEKGGSRDKKTQNRPCVRLRRLPMAAYRPEGLSAAGHKLKIAERLWRSPSNNLAFTRYCHHQYCMVYGIQKGGRWGGACCEMGVQ